MWLLNYIALGIYQGSYSLIIQVGKANFIRANEHPKLPDLFLFLFSMQGSRVKMSCYDLTSLAWCWRMSPNILCWWERCNRLFLEIKYVGNMIVFRSTWLHSLFSHLLGLSAKVYRSHCITFCSQLIWPPSQNRKFSPIALFLMSEWST